LVQTLVDSTVVTTVFPMVAAMVDGKAVKWADD
jgi:hypothetical protein